MAFSKFDSSGDDKLDYSFQNMLKHLYWITFRIIHTIISLIWLKTIDFREFCEMINKKAEEDAAAAHK
jgi:Ca2+-binding EF-hand superfamily protein